MLLTFDKTINPKIFPNSPRKKMHAGKRILTNELSRKLFILFCQIIYLKNKLILLSKIRIRIR